MGNPLIWICHRQDRGKLIRSLKSHHFWWMLIPITLSGYDNFDVERNFQGSVATHNPVNVTERAHHWRVSPITSIDWSNGKYCCIPLCCLLRGCVAFLPSQKYKRENIATRLIRHLLSQNGEKSWDMFVSDAILNQSLLDVMCLC